MPGTAGSGHRPRFTVSARIRKGILYWQADTGPGGTDSFSFLHVATFLPVRRWRDVMPFLRMSRLVEAQLHGTPGLVRYGLRADLLRKRFWTVSVWSDREVLTAFVGAEPHRAAVSRFAEWAGDGAAFAEWEAADGPLNWDEALSRLERPTFYYAPGR